MKKEDKDVCVAACRRILDIAYDARDTGRTDLPDLTNEIDNIEKLLRKIMNDESLEKIDKGRLNVVLIAAIGNMQVIVEAHQRAIDQMTKIAKENCE